MVLPWKLNDFVAAESSLFITVVQALQQENLGWVSKDFKLLPIPIHLSNTFLPDGLVILNLKFS